jgi:hypothetical protein
VRAPKRRRPPLRKRVEIPPGVDLLELAAGVSYVGSPEHKRYPLDGRFGPRSDATVCDPGLSDRTRLTQWLRAGITRGNVGAPWDASFPRYVWYRVDGITYEARLINSESGEYKGWPLRDEESPPWMNGE